MTVQLTDGVSTIGVEVTLRYEQRFGYTSHPSLLPIALDSIQVADSTLSGLFAFEPSIPPEQARYMASQGNGRYLASRIAQTAHIQNSSGITFLVCLTKQGDDAFGFWYIPPMPSVGWSLSITTCDTTSVPLSHIAPTYIRLWETIGQLTIIQVSSFQYAQKDYDTEPWENVAIPAQLFSSPPLGLPYPILAIDTSPALPSYTSFSVPSTTLV